MEFFIEGGRSRSGKLMSPKMGLLSMVLDAHFEGRVKDAYIVPISIGYEKVQSPDKHLTFATHSLTNLLLLFATQVIETEGYIQELLGKAKKPETLIQLVQAIELLKLNFGSIDVRFGSLFAFCSGDFILMAICLDTPFSLKQFISSEAKTRNFDLFGSRDSDLVAKQRRQIVNILAYRYKLVHSLFYKSTTNSCTSVMYQINQLSVALPSSLVVTLLLSHHGRGISKALLIEKVKWLIEMIQQRGGQVLQLEKNDSDSIGKLVDQVTILLGNSINRHTNLLELVYTPAKRFELSYYRNQLIHLFIPESIIAASIYSFKRQNQKRYFETF